MSNILASSAPAYPFAYAGPRPVMDPKERFYHQFQIEIAAIQDRIAKLGSIAVVGGERQDAKDSILTSISKLSLEVADASEYIPAYDRRTYSASVKALTDKLNDEVAQLTPRSRFQFKRPAVTAASASAAAAAAQNDTRLLRGVPDAVTVDAEKPDAVGALPSFAAKNYNVEMDSGTGPNRAAGVRKPSFSSAREVAIAGHTGLHIILPLSASRATSSGSLTDLHRCVVDMSVPTSSPDVGGGGAAFLSLALKTIDGSLIVAGHVNGPVHVTGLRDCILVVSARQVRIHECHNVDVYLHCTSRPIIEDCSGMRFAPLPQHYASALSSLSINDDDNATQDQWDQVDDFKWLKADHSPNWSILPEADRLPESVWTGAVAGSPGLGTEDVLRAVGIKR